MASQTRQKVITVPILSNISRSKVNQTMKFGQLIKYNLRNIFFFKLHVEDEAWRLGPDLFLLFKKTLYKIKASGQCLSFDIFW